MGRLFQEWGAGKQHRVLCAGWRIVVQPVLRSVAGQGLPDRIRHADDSLLLHTDGAQRGVLKRVGHHTEGMERVFEEDHRSADSGHRGAHHLFVPAAIGINLRG